jgi:LAO/AO transport system kinase
MEARSVPSALDIASRVGRGEERALGRLISGLEDGEEWAAEALRALRASPVELSSARDGLASGRSRPDSGGVAQIVGVTGAPGSGKSTLVDKLIAAYRGKGERVAVLAVDPSSPFSGGALLGDRIRMQSRSVGASGADGGVFIRSLASRGKLGGLSRATAQSARALEAAGYGLVLVETVGIGQSEVDIAALADTVVLVSMPGSGDDIQSLKAGVMEIGDIFVVNKADREGADRLVREILEMLELRPDAASESGRGEDLPPVLKTVAETGEGVPELASALDARWAKLCSSGELERKRLALAAAEARGLLAELLLGELEALCGELEGELALRITRGEISAHGAAKILYNSLMDKGERR